MHDHVVNCVNPKTGEVRSTTLKLSTIQLSHAKQSMLELSSKMKRSIPDGFMPCDESFCTP